MSELEDKVLAVVGDLLASTVWDLPGGGTGPLEFYKGSIPKQGAADAVGLDDPQKKYEDPFLLVRYVGASGSRVQKHDSVLLWGQLWGDNASTEIFRLGGILESILEVDLDGLVPWGLEDEISIKYGDDFGNQADPIYILQAELKFYRG